MLLDKKFEKNQNGLFLDDVWVIDQDDWYLFKSLSSKRYIKKTGKDKNYIEILKLFLN